MAVIFRNILIHFKMSLFKVKESVIEKNIHYTYVWPYRSIFCFSNNLITLKIFFEKYLLLFTRPG